MNIIKAIAGLFRRAPTGPIAGQGADCRVKVSGDYSICCICATDFDTNDPHPPICPMHGRRGQGGAGGSASVGPYYAPGQKAQGSRGGVGGVVATDDQGRRIR